VSGGALPNPWRLAPCWPGSTPTVPNG